MPDLLDRRFPLSNWTSRPKARQSGSIAPFSQPDLDAPKQFFITVRSMAAAEVVASNLPRTVRRIVREFETVSSEGDFKPSDELIGYWHVESLAEEAATGAGTSGQKPHSSFLENARRLDRRNQTDAALDLIFDQVDEMLLADHFEHVDQLLNEITPSDYSVELLLGLLTATLPAKNQLPHRYEFFQRVSDTLQDHGELKEGLLVGLD